MPISDYTLQSLVDTHEHSNGYYAASYPHDWATLTLESNRYYGSRFVAPVTFTQTGMAFRVITASGTDDPHEFLIHDATTGTRLASGGSVLALMNGVGNRLRTWSYTYTAGKAYYIGFVATSTATVVAWTTSGGGSDHGTSGLFGSGLGAIEMTSTSAFGIGNTAAITGTSRHTVPAITIRK
jgi:hypothetical protein